MGLTVLTIEVDNPADPQVTETSEFLVDSGAVYSVVPTEVLERLGIQTLVDQEFRLADGSKIVHRKESGLFRRGELVGVADVIFDEEGDGQLLGTLALAPLGLVLDPLRELPMTLGGMSNTTPLATRQAD